MTSIAQNGRGCWLEVYGSNGTLSIGSFNQKAYVHGFSLRMSTAGGQLKEVQPDIDLNFRTTWTDGRIAPVKRIQEWWANSIHNGIPTIPGLNEGLTSQVVCDAIKESSRSGLQLAIDTFA